MSAVEPATSTHGPAIEPLDERGSAVRFESQCVIIPDLAHRSRRPRVVTKSYALPLWKRRASSAGPSTSAPSEDASFEDLVLRVPLPTFSLRPPSVARSVDDAPLPPCLVHRPQPPGPASPGTSPPIRHARTPRKHSSSQSDIVTVPLRPCCAACQSVTEAALADGDAWPEHFSRAASRRRSLSVDGSPRTITVAGSAASASYGDLGVAISVDEIDKRRRSSDNGPPTTNLEMPWSSDAKAGEECRVSFILRRAAADARSPPSPTRVTPATPRIPEEEDDEDESELFPLPSPKRTPTPSPTPSPVGSLSSLTVVQAHQPSTTSPAPLTCSGDCASLHLSTQHLAPPPCSSSSSLSLPKLSESTADLPFPEDPPRAPSPYLLSALPTLSGRVRSRSPSPRISCTPPTPTGTLPPATDRALPKTPQSHDYVPELTLTTIPSSPGSPQLSASPRHSPTHIRFPWRSRRSVSADITSPTLPLRTSSSSSPSTSPTLSASPSTKKSFSTSSPRLIIADVLRGVGAMGSGGLGPRM